MRKFNYVMTPHRFVKEVICLYDKSRYFSYSNIPNVTRGRLHSISSRLEDLLCLFLVKNLRYETNMWIDKGITYIDKHDNKHIMYPDIIIVQNDTIMEIIDVKTDIGYQRKQFLNNCENDNERIKYLINCKRVSYRVVKHGDVRHWKVSNKLHYHKVILSIKNISEKRYQKVMDGVSKYHYLKFYGLTKDTHPNNVLIDDYLDKKIDEIIVLDEFDRLLSNVTQNLT